jgi:hypothetical protein
VPCMNKLRLIAAECELVLWLAAVTMCLPTMPT